MSTKPTFGTKITNKEEVSKIVSNTEEVACAWEREDKYGRKYLRVKVRIGGQNKYINLFSNKKKKEGDNSPSFVGYKSQQNNPGE